MPHSLMTIMDVRSVKEIRTLFFRRRRRSQAAAKRSGEICSTMMYPEPAAAMIELTKRAASAKFSLRKMSVIA